MGKLKMVVALITKDNDYQREQASVAAEAATRLGIEVEVLYADSDAIEQAKQLLAVTRRAEEQRPNAIVVEPVGTAMPQVAKAALDHGIGWVVLNRDADYIDELRAGARAPIGSLACDNTEVGRIQGRQFAILLPQGGRVLYIEGPATDTSKQRRAGLSETLPANIEIRPARGKWTEDSAFQAMNARLPRHTSEPPSIDLVGCQNDAMAMGARRAVEGLPPSPHRDEWLRLPFTGCDGVPSSGQRWVHEGALAATVITPALTGIALDALAKALGGGAPLPARSLTKPLSFPTLEELRRGPSR